jgi:hypothetical protein
LDGEKSSILEVLVSFTTNTQTNETIGIISLDVASVSTVQNDILDVFKSVIEEDSIAFELPGAVVSADHNLVGNGITLSDDDVGREHGLVNRSVSIATVVFTLVLNKLTVFRAETGNVGVKKEKHVSFRINTHAGSVEVVFTEINSHSKVVGVIMEGETWHGRRVRGVEISKVGLALVEGETLEAAGLSKCEESKEAKGVKGFR